MMFLFLMFFILYVAFAIFFIRSTWKTSSKLQRRIVIAFFVLLPSWDMVLGYIVYYAALPFIPKEVIYETAETDGIYYEGGPRNHLLFTDVYYFEKMNKEKRISFADDDLRRGYKYVESRITSIGDSITKSPVSPPQTYRCTSLPPDPKNPRNIYQQCVAVENIQSEYMVSTWNFQFARNEMNCIKIYNRTTGNLLGEYREVTRLGYDFIPFFIWLEWGEGSGHRYSRPEKSRLFDFQFDVLKVKQQNRGEFHDSELNR